MSSFGNNIDYKHLKHATERVKLWVVQEFANILSMESWESKLFCHPCKTRTIDMKILIFS